jgi:putative aminopeptidase FrvX
MPELLRSLVECPGISGYEDRVRDLVLQSLGRDADIDAMGNVSLTIGEGDTELLIAAHMDEIGMVITHIDDRGYLRVRAVGGLDPRVVAGQRVTVVGSDVTVRGGVGLKPPHLMEDRAEMKSAVPFSRMYVDIGADSKEEVEAMGIRELDYIVLEKELVELNDRYWMGRSLDDRLGCWILIRLFERLRDNPPPIKVTLAWSVQEEIGLRGAEAVARRVNPDYVIPIDTLSSGDIPEGGLHFGNAVPGKGPALRMIDNRAIGSPQFRDQIVAIAETAGIPVQISVTGGGTDGAALQMTGAHMVPLAFPMRYTHAPCESVNKQDVWQMLDLLESICRHLA